MDELLTMTKKEITRLEAMQRIKDKRLTQKEAAGMLSLSVRQVKRLYRAYKAQGAQGLISARRGKPSNHGLAAGVEEEVLNLLKEKYKDFGPTLAHEKLTEVHQFQKSRESVRRIMIEEQIWKPKRAKQPAVHQLRERRACIGELVQIDGSDHAWFEERGPKCTLLVYIDDATGSSWSCGLLRRKPLLLTLKLRDTIWSVMANRWPSTATSMASFGSTRNDLWEPPVG